MKIIIDCRMWGIKYTGVGRYTENLVRNLEKIDTENDYFLLLKKEHNHLRFKKNFHCIEANFNHYSFAEQTFLPKLINSLPHDLVHFTHFNVPLLYKKSFIVTVHDLIMHKRNNQKPTRNMLISSINQIAYKRVFSHAVNKSSYIIAPSITTKKEILRNYKKIDQKKIDVILEGLDSRVQPDESKIEDHLTKFSAFIKEKYFIYVGNAFPHKNVDRLVQAFARIQEKKNKAHLVLVLPENAYKLEIQKKISSLHIKNTHIYSSLSDSELGYLYNHALSFAYPSLQEGFGLPGLEAISNGTILLASDIPIFREIYKKKAIYFNPYDYSSIEKEMMHILSLSKEERSKIKDNQSSILPSFSLAKMAQETKNVYEKLFNSL